MLVDMMTGEELNKIPYPSDYRMFMSRMAPEEISKIKTEIDGMIRGDKIVTSEWKPKDWKESAFFPIYDKAARRNKMLAFKCLGLLIWEVFMDRPEKWTTGRFERKWELTGSRTYFRVP